ncbi:MAG: response regulator [Lachnospiraceae bacterium]
MRTFYIADDEIAIRNGLKCIIDWESLGFSLCGEAGNGEDALHDITQLSPDLVLMDIRMPRMSGLDTVRSLRAEGFHGHIIILSGYSDFKYAQEAIRSGVDFYLTKPIDEDELYDAIVHVKERLEKNTDHSDDIERYKEKARNVILHDLVTGHAVPSDIRKEDIMLDADIYQIVIYENFSVGLTDLTYNFADLLKVTNQGSHFFEHFEEEHKDVILLKGTFALERFQNFLDHYENTPPQKGSPLDSLFIAYGRPVNDIMSINESYLDAATLLSRRFFCMQGQHTLGYEELPNVEAIHMELSDEKMAEFCTLLTDFLQTYNRKKVAETLMHLEEYLYQVRDDIADVKLFLSDLYLQIKEKMNHIYNTVNIPFPTNTAVLDFINKKYYLYEIILFFSEQAEIIMNAIGNSSRDSVLDDILYYIDHNYQTNIKLESIAPLFGYNSAYLGKIFNKTVGESFNSYVDHIRIEHSKELLMQNKLKVYEIAEQVGYKNVDYFHKKFKKYVGESPAEFRKQLDGK